MSFIWFQPFLGGFGDPPPVGALGDIGSDVGYYAAFEHAHTGDWRWSLPWSHPTGQLFWTRYLGGRAPGSIDALTAWERLVPFRYEAFQLKDADRLFRVSARALVYPFGVALIVNAARDDSAELSMHVNAAVDFVHGMRIVEVASTGRRRAGSLDQVAARLLRRSRQAAFGEQREEEISPDRISVATVVQGTGYAADTPPSDGVRRALRGLASWSSDWPTLSPLPTSSTDIPLSRSLRRPGSVLYGEKHGRTVWFPNRFVGRSRTTATQDALGGLER